MLVRPRTDAGKRDAPARRRGLRRPAAGRLGAGFVAVVFFAVVFFAVVFFAVVFLVAAFFADALVVFSAAMCSRYALGRDQPAALLAHRCMVARRAGAVCACTSKNSASRALRWAGDDNAIAGPAFAATSPEVIAIKSSSACARRSSRSSCASCAGHRRPARNNACAGR